MCEIISNFLTFNLTEVLMVIATGLIAYSTFVTIPKALRKNRSKVFLTRIISMAYRDNITMNVPDDSELLIKEILAKFNLQEDKKLVDLGVEIIEELMKEGIFQIITPKGSYKVGRDAFGRPTRTKIDD